MPETREKYGEERNHNTEERIISPVSRIVNRHMARLLQELQDANCPVIYVDAVKSKMIWLRSDLEQYETGGNR